MSDTGFVSIILGSGDSTAVGNSSEFTVTLGSPIDLSDGGDYEMALVSVSFEKPAVVPRSCFVYCDILKSQNIGSNSLPFLFRTRPITAADPNPVFLEQSSSIIPWKPIAASRNFIQQIEILLSDSTGAYLPLGGSETVVELIIRQVASG